MARKSKADAAPSVEDLRPLVDDLMDLHRGRISKMQRRIEFLEGRNPISFPEDAENRQVVRSRIFAQQLRLARGLFADYPTSRLPLEETVSQKERDRLQTVENFLNGVYPLMERQARPVWNPTRQDVLLHGVGCWRVDLDLARMAGQMPVKETYQDESAYLADRGTAVRRMGTAGGLLPLRWTWVDITSFFWADDFDSPSLAVGVEVRLRRISELLRDPRYKDELKDLQAEIDTLKGDVKDAQLKAWARLVIVEDHDWQTTMILPETLDSSNVRAGARSTSNLALGGAYRLGKIVGQRRTLLGRPQYVLVKGLRTNSSDPEQQFWGICDASEELINAYDHIQSFSLTEYANFQAFPPVLILQDKVVDQFGNTVLPNEGDGGEQLNTPEVREGYHAKVPLPVGQKMQFMRPDGTTQEAAARLTQLKHDIGLNGIPDSLFDLSHGRQSGYSYNSLVNTVQSGWKEIQEGFQQAMVQTDLLILELARKVDEELSIAAPGKSRGSVNWIKLDPKEGLQDLSFEIQAIYEFKKPQDALSDAQLYHLLTDDPNPAMTKATAMELHLGIEDPESEILQLRIQRWLESPEVAQVETAMALKLAGVDLKAILTGQESFSLDDLNAIGPAAAGTLARMTQPGMPGYAAAQQWLQSQGVNGLAAPPQPPGGPAPTAPLGGPPQVGPGGPVVPPSVARAGQAPGLPSGPHRTGGMG